MRISATTLESFRLWRDRDVVSEEQLVAQIQGTFQPTPRVLLGIAYGRILERPDDHRLSDGGYARDGFRFEADAVEPALAVINRRGVFEVKATKRYGPHTVVSKADHLLGSELKEFKTRVGRVCTQKYADSYQWRFMADMFKPTSVTYHVFRLSEAPYALDAIETLSLAPYPSLSDDCGGLLEEFVAYVHRRGLEAFLPDRVGELEGPMFEDAPTRPSPAKRLRQLRDQLRDRRRAERDEPLPLGVESCRGELPPIAELPTPTFTLRPPVPAGAPHQPSLF